MTTLIFLGKLNRHITETLTLVVATVLIENIQQWRDMDSTDFCFVVFFFLKVRCSSVLFECFEHTPCIPSRQHIPKKSLKEKLEWKFICSSSPLSQLHKKVAEEERFEKKKITFTIIFCSYWNMLLLTIKFINRTGFMGFFSLLSLFFKIESILIQEGIKGMILIMREHFGVFVSHTKSSEEILNKSFLSLRMHIYLFKSACHISLQMLKLIILKTVNF